MLQVHFCWSYELFVSFSVINFAFVWIVKGTNASIWVCLLKTNCILDCEFYIFEGASPRCVTVYTFCHVAFMIITRLCHFILKCFFGCVSSDCMDPDLTCKYPITQSPEASENIYQKELVPCCFKITIYDKWARNVTWFDTSVNVFWQRRSIHWSNNDNALLKGEKQM